MLTPNLIMRANENGHEYSLRDFLIYCEDSPDMSWTHSAFPAVLYLCQSVIVSLHLHEVLHVAGAVPAKPLPSLSMNFGIHVVMPVHTTIYIYIYPLPQPESKITSSRQSC